MRVHSGIVMVAFGAVLTVSGCGRDGAGGPARPEALGAAIQTGVYTADIGPSGGTLAGDVATATFPPGCFSGTSTATLTTSVSGGMARATLDFTLDPASNFTVSLARPSWATPVDEFDLVALSGASSQFLEGQSNSGWITSSNVPHLAEQIDLAE
ncbi:MAG: hypothetical protein IT349_03625 [Candidatus Eisenbacteria bacterium]|nr:hypothetical protein [Candidatus Eisenbacteria bacterium]MCC7141171.1 hypothetical protein [Candidatus Eisenbacteria bacterium]